MNRVSLRGCNQGSMMKGMKSIVEGTSVAKEVLLIECGGGFANDADSCR